MKRNIAGFFRGSVEYEVDQSVVTCARPSFPDLRGHKIYLSTAPNYDFPTFRELVREVTQEFKRISEGVMDIERRLRMDCAAPHLADFVVALQEEEKVKLELTAKLQLAKQNLLENPEEQNNQTDVVSMKRRLNEAIERINENLVELKYEMNDL